jgi:hypothetical protein
LAPEGHEDVGPEGNQGARLAGDRVVSGHGRDLLGFPGGVDECAFRSRFPERAAPAQPSADAVELSGAPVLILRTRPARLVADLVGPSRISHNSARLGQFRE